MPLPRVQPLAPIASKVPFDDPAWQFEIKYDGFRALCYLERRRNRFISRNGNILSRFDALADQTASEIIGFDEAILDGEVIAPDVTGRPQFYDLLKHACRPAYVVFDLLWLSRYRPSVMAPSPPPPGLGRHIDGGLPDHLPSGVSARSRPAAL
jgi:bifunctional non-homologous end joining protein LigD